MMSDFNQTFSYNFSFVVRGVGWLNHKVYFDDEDDFLLDFVIGQRRFWL